MRRGNRFDPDAARQQQREALVAKIQRQGGTITIKDRIEMQRLDVDPLLDIHRARGGRSIRPASEAADEPTPEEITPARNPELCARIDPPRYAEYCRTGIDPGPSPSARY